MADVIGEATVRISGDITPLQQAVEKVKQTTQELKGLEGFTVNWGEGTGSIQEYNQYVEQATADYKAYVEEVANANTVLEQNVQTTAQISQAQQQTTASTSSLGEKFKSLKQQVAELGYKAPASFYNMKEAIEQTNRVGRTFLIGLSAAIVAFGKSSIKELGKYDESVAASQERMEKSISRLKASIGQLVYPIAQAIGGMADWLSQNQQLVAGIGTFIAIVGGSAGLIALITKLKGAFLALRASMGGVIGLIGAIAALIVGMNTEQQDFVDTTDELNSRLEEQERNEKALAEATKRYNESLADVEKEIEKLNQQIEEAEHDYRQSLKKILVEHENTVEELTDQIKSANDEYQRAVDERYQAFYTSQAKEEQAHQEKVEELMTQLNFLQRYNNAYNKEKLEAVRFALAREEALYKKRTEAERAELELQNAYEKQKRDEKLAAYEKELAQEQAFLEKHRDTLEAVRDEILADEVEILKKQYEASVASYREQIELAKKRGADAAASYVNAYSDYIQNNKKLEQTFSNLGTRTGKAYKTSLVNQAIEALGSVTALSPRNAGLSNATERRNIEEYYKQKYGDRWWEEGHRQGMWAEGGFTGRGDKYEVAGIVHRGEYVLPQEMVDQSTGMPKIGGNITINVNGTFATSDLERRKVAEQIVQALNQTNYARLGV